MSLIKWIDLRDNVDKARLKIGSIETDDGRKRSILFIVGLDNRSGRWQAAIDKLGFMASPKGKYLVRQVRDGEKLKPANFHAVWPNATLAEMPGDQVHLDLAATRRTRATATPRNEEEATAAQQFSQQFGVVTRLGRNAEGDEVFSSAIGRFIQQGEKRVFESKVLLPAMFLRAPDPANLDACADGFVQAMLQGEVQHSDDLDRFIHAVTDQAGPYGAATYDRMAEVVDAAMVRFLNASYETAQDAYGDAGRLYEYLPPYKGAGRGKAAMPLPMAVIAQRLLGDTAGKRVLVPNAWDGASFAFLARNTQIHAFRGDKDLSRHVGVVREEEVTWADRFDPAAHQGADGLFFNADPLLDIDGSRKDYREALAALRALAQGARAVLVLAGDNARQPGELSGEARRFFEALGRRFDIEAAMEVGAELTRQLGTETPLRLVALRNRPSTASSKKVDRLEVLHSWDELKAAVDEAIVSIDLREAESEAIDVERVARENEFQRPYIAFSKVGEARTMVPKNLQAPLQFALSKLEQRYGGIDGFVEEQMGFGPNTLGDRFSPEQVDAVGLAIGRLLSGRGFIVGDETGVGKGRSQPLDAKVLTPGGWRCMGNLRVGDQVITVDGTPTTITGVFPQGRTHVYEITFSDGATTRASADHLWLTMTRNQRFRSKTLPMMPCGSYALHTTEELLHKLHQIHSVPLVSPAAFPPREVPVDPYLLGVLIGDGCLRLHSVQVVLAEEEMLTEVAATLPDTLVLKHRNRVHFDVVKPKRAWKGLASESNELLVGLRALGLAGKRAHEKFVPEQYLLNTPAVRLGVLQGLLDTDGTASKQGAVVFTTVSNRLARDVVDLARSLGGTATITKKATVRREAMNVFIRLPNGTPPFRLSRKAARVRGWTKYQPTRYIKHIRQVEDAECQCISVAHPSHLYVTDDYVVTHNTLSALATWAEKQGRNVIFVTDRANLFSDLVRDLRDIEEWGRFRPFIMNADGVLLDVFTNQILQQGTPPKVMNEVLEQNKALEDLRANLVFATYSQVSGEDSPKADWLLAQAEQALVIVDEAHVAAGSDSNTSRVVTDLVNRAWGVVYSSATWAKSSENLHVYGRAFSETINVGSLASTMKTGGEPFSEVFSSMLARDGAFIRREHDLSKIEFVVEIDEARKDRNSELSDKVAEILSAMTFVAGDINKMLVRLNSETVADLRRAREARVSLDVGQLRSRGRRRAPAQAVEDVQPAGQADPAAQQQAPVAPVPAAQQEQEFTLEGDAAEAARATGARNGFILKSHFGAGSVLYQVMRRFLAVLNADHTAELALKAVEQNRKPVIVFDDTGEAFVKRLIEQEVIPGLDGERAMMPEDIRPPTIKDLLRHVMKRMGVITKAAATEDAVLSAGERRALADGRAEEEVDIEEVVQATDEASRQGMVMTVLDLPGLTPQQQDDYNKGMERIMKMIEELPPLPLNAIDVVMARLADAGLKVGEISGRKVRLEAPPEAWQLAIDAPEWENLRCAIRQRNTKKTAVNATVYGFNSGELDVVCINRSAATGLSLHASPRFDDIRRRELVEMQITENPTERIQLYGRVNRYDQVVTPRVSIATTGIFGEVRQLMQQNKKLARLSANIRSSRENAAEIKFIPDLLNSVGEEVCRRFLEENGGIRNRLGITDKELEAPHFNAAQRLTSRVALLKVAEQKMVYEELYEMFADALNRYELAGENPLKPRELDLRAITKDQMIAIGVEMDGYGSAFDGPVYLKRIEWKEEVRPIEWTQLVATVNANRQELVAGGYAHWSDQASTADPAMDTGEPPAPATDADEQLDPLSVMAPAQAVLVSQVLPAHGFAAGIAAVPGAEVRQIRYGNMVQHLARILDAKMRIELSGSDFPDVQAALAAEKSNAVKRAYARKLWVEQKLPQMVPGCVVGLPAGKSEINGVAELLREYAVITCLRPAPKGKEAMLSRWKVELVAPGDQKPRVVTLVSLMEGCDVVSVTRNGMPAIDSVGDVVIRGDMFGTRDTRERLERLPIDVDTAPVAQANRELQDAGMTWDTIASELEYRRMKREFTSRTLERGLVKRKAMIMDGNMYLASEWAASTKQGHGVIYTDERGLRHRAIMLNRNLGRHSLLLQHMPVRLWSSQMVSRFFARLLQPAEGEATVPPNWTNQGYIVPTEFKTAMKWLTGTSMEVAGTVVGVMPGKGIALLVDKANLARTARALRGDQRSQLRRNHPQLATYTDEQKQAAQAEMCTIRSTTKAKRGEKPLVFLDCGTPQQFQNAVDLICRAAGIELYLPRGTALGQLADKIQQDYFQERRREARAQMGLPPEDEPQPVTAPTDGQPLLEDTPLTDLARELGQQPAAADAEPTGGRGDDEAGDQPRRERMVA